MYLRVEGGRMKVARAWKCGRNDEDRNAKLEGGVALNVELLTLHSQISLLLLSLSSATAATMIVPVTIS